MTLSLPLLMAWIRANDADDTVAPDDLALAANLLDRCLYSHDVLLYVGLLRAEDNAGAA